MVSNDWHSHIACHCGNLELTDAITLLIMPSVSSDANTGITWPKSHGESYFSQFKLRNKIVPLTVLSSVMWSWHWCQHCMTKTSHATQNDHIADPFSIAWQQCQSLLASHDQKNVLPHFDNCDLMNALGAIYNTIGISKICLDR